MSTRKQTEQIGAVSRTTIAKMYGVDVRVFNSWVDINPTLKKTFEPYQRKKALPPIILQTVFATIGNPV